VTYGPAVETDLYGSVGVVAVCLTRFAGGAPSDVHFGTSGFGQHPDLFRPAGCLDSGAVCGYTVAREQ